jgi:DNA-binding GntR family transcriptional regulator
MEQAQIARSNADDAYQAIRKLIVTVALPPGSPFTVGELVERVGLGKTPVREALLRLKLENLIAVQPRSGYRVVPVTLKDIRDTCRVLGRLEADAVECVAGDPGSVARLASPRAQLEQGTATDGSGETTDGWIRADWLFHLALARNQDNQVQAEIMIRLNQLVLRFRYMAIALGVPGRMLAHEHDDLLKAVSEGNASAAVAATRDCWRETETGLLGGLTETAPVQSANVWSADLHSFYLDAGPDGPATPDVFEPRLLAKRRTTRRRGARTPPPAASAASADDDS